MSEMGQFTLILVVIVESTLIAAHIVGLAIRAKRSEKEKRLSTSAGSPKRA